MTTIDVTDKVRVWKIGQGSANVGSWNNYRDNEGYNLFCQTNGRYLTWKKVPVGINLAFIEESSVGKTHFRLPDGKERDILSGESVALGIGGGEAFLRYAKRPVGINLEWSAAPVFEWRIFGANSQLGTPIQENSLVAFLNDKVEPSPDFLVHFNRLPEAGTDIGWTTSPGFWDHVSVGAEKLAVEGVRMAVRALIP